MKIQSKMILRKVIVSSLLLVCILCSKLFAQGDLHVKGKIRADSLANNGYLLIYADSSGTLDTLPAGLPGQVLISNGFDKPYWGFIDGSDSLLYSTFLTVGTDANTNEKVLGSFDIPSNTLTTNSQSIYIYAYGTFANTPNNKTIKLKFGNTIFNPPYPVNGYYEIWIFEILLTRVSNNTQKGIYEFTYNVQGQSGYYGDWRHDRRYLTSTENLSNVITIQITGQNSSASANDIVLEGLQIKLIK